LIYSFKCGAREIVPVVEKHLDLIQAAISRMAGNSFQMKAWNVALASAAVGFAATKDSHPRAAFLAVIPSFVFWLLDAYYLRLEKAFRELYKQAVAGTATAYSMTPKPTIKMWFEAFFAPSVSLIHGIMLAVIFRVTYYAK
jgi:hypothetical protein